MACSPWDTVWIPFPRKKKHSVGCVSEGYKAETGQKPVDSWNSEPKLQYANKPQICIKVSSPLRKKNKQTEGPHMF